MLEKISLKRNTAHIMIIIIFKLMLTVITYLMETCQVRLEIIMPPILFLMITYN